MKSVCIALIHEQTNYIEFIILLIYIKKKKEFFLKILGLSFILISA